LSHIANDYVKKLFRDRVTRRQKLLLWSLADYHNTARRAAWPSLRTLAEESLMDMRECRRVIDELIGVGLIERIKGGSGPGDFNEYRFVELDGKDGHMTPLSQNGKDGQKDGRKGGQKDGREDGQNGRAIRNERELELKRELSTPPDPPLPPGKGLTVRDRRKLNEEIWRLMEKHPAMQMREALETACAELLFPINAAVAAIEEAGMKDALSLRRRL